MPAYAWIVLIVVAVAAVVLGIVLSRRADRKRREAFEALATANGWTYWPDLPDPSDRFPGFTPFDRGHDRLARDVLTGTSAGREFEAFTYRYVVTSGSGKDEHDTTYWFEVVATPMPGVAPGLTIEPETLGKKLFDALGGEDIDFESDEFSRAFWVRCSDRRFAYDVITPTMMELLLAGERKLTWQWRGATLVVTRSGTLHPEQAAALVAQVTGFIDHLPRTLAGRPTHPPSHPT